MIHESDLTKLYYSIGEVAGMLDVNASLIRFWEKEFPSVNPKKSQKGNRRFTAENILELQRIYILVKQEGHTLDGAKKALKSKTIEKSEIADRMAVITKLERVKQKLLQLKG
jgi:DNA-binding transcriptional MerR regulator